MSCFHCTSHMLTVERDNFKSPELHGRRHDVCSELRSRMATRREQSHTRRVGSHCSAFEGESESRGGSPRDLVCGPDVGSLCVCLSGLLLHLYKTVCCCVTFAATTSLRSLRARLNRTSFLPGGRCCTLGHVRRLDSLID